MSGKYLRDSFDLGLVTFLAVAGMPLTLPGLEANPLRALWAILMILALPGYALTMAIFPPARLARSERTLLSVGLSLAATILGSFLLNLAPGGMDSGSWTGWLAVVTVLACAAAFLRRRPEQEAGATVLRLNLKLRPGQVILGCVAGVTIVAAIGLSRLQTPVAGIQGYTELWIMPLNGSDRSVVQVGVKSQELTQTTYRLQMLSEGRVVQEWPNIDLKPGQIWKTQAQVPFNLPVAEIVEARLYRIDAPSLIYRDVKLWRPNGDKIER